MEENVLSFANDTDTHCDFSITDHILDTENTNDIHTNIAPKYPTIHSQRKHTYRDTFGDAHIQYHDFDNQDSLTFRDKYTALLQQELQNPYWNLHDPITTKSYQISQDMDIETMPHAMYFTGDTDTVTKINHVPYQTIEYNDNGMFTAKLMNDTSIEIFIDNGATPSILPLLTYNKFPILHTYPKTESNTPIHTGGGMITCHFWLEIPQMRLKTLLLKLSEYTIDLKYQKGSEMHTSDALSRLHNFTDTPDQKDVIPLNFLQHFTPHYTEHSYSHLVENLYAHKTKILDATTVKRKCSRPPKQKLQIPTSKPRTLMATKNLTT